MKRSVEWVRSHHLCHGCGACCVVCPVDAVSMEENQAGFVTARVDDGLCIDCGLCLKVCTGQGLSEADFNFPEDPFVGDVLASYVGRTTNERFYELGQSGGVATSLLADALASGLIDVAVTVEMDYGSPPRAQVVLARCVEALVRSQKSKYVTVPLLEVVSVLKSEESRFAVVGTPCHLHGLHLLLKRFPEVQERFVFSIGLMCAGVLSNRSLDLFARRIGTLQQSTAQKVDLRDKQKGGYPGLTHLQSRAGRSCVVSSQWRMEMKSYLTPHRCHLCFDKMNVFSDVTVGDPHGVAGVDRKGGESVVLVRSDAGRKVLDALRSSLCLREVSLSVVAEGQLIDAKRKHWRGYALAVAEKAMELPRYPKVVEGKSLRPVSIDGSRVKLERFLHLMGFTDSQQVDDWVYGGVRFRVYLVWILAPWLWVKRTVRSLLKKKKRA